MGRNGMPLGGDTYTTWQPLTKLVLAQGPVQFVQNQFRSNFVEVLYPLLASIPVYFGVAINVVEIYFPILLAVASVGGTALLAREFKDSRVAVLTVAFSAGWFAIYRMGADFRGQLLAFTLLLFATVLLLRMRKTSHLVRDVPLFVGLVVLAALAHVETTAVFVSVWALTFIIFGLRQPARRRTLIITLTLSIAIALPILLYAINRYPILFSCGSSCRPYPVLPAYWLEVLGPEIVLVVLGLGVALNQALNRGGEMTTSLVVVWSLFCLIVGSLAYIFPTFDLAYSDRTLLMLPVPMLSAISTTWLCDRLGALRRYSNLISIMIILIPAVTAPAIFAYLVPQRFRYYPPYVP